MANVRSGNTFFVDTTSDSGTASSYIDEKNMLLLGVLAYGAVDTNVVLISDKAAASAAVGSSKLKLTFDTALRPQFIDLADTPVVFPNGIWLTLTGSPVLTLILQSQGR